MKIVGLIWLEEIVEKLEVKHRVIPEEAEQVFRNRPGVRRMNRGHYRGEDVYRVGADRCRAAIWSSSSSTRRRTRR